MVIMMVVTNYITIVSISSPVTIIGLMLLLMMMANLLVLMMVVWANNGWLLIGADIHLDHTGRQTTVMGL